MRTVADPHVFLKLPREEAAEIISRALDLADAVLTGRRGPVCGAWRRSLEQTCRQLEALREVILDGELY